MNVFVLSTGRCGTVTFTEACYHISNFSSAHESRARILGDEHFDYPENHIEIDNRLSWFLGRLDKKYGKEAYYVHLLRDDHGTATSYKKRYGSGIIRGYTKGMMMGRHPKAVAMEVCLDYCKTVNSNIELFLKDKPHQMTIHLETAESQFIDFWKWIGAKGNLDNAVGEWSVAHNKTPESFLVVKKIFGKGS
ncbi:MAG: hypothetical protein GY705_06845 [Bacteroidetes bacterium]|nr:hypothetical protein [Bacteroidota bacterium]